MSKSLNFTYRQTKLILVIAVLTGFLFMSIAEETLILTILTMFNGDDFPRQGVILFDMGDSKCEYYSLNQYLHSSRDQIIQENARECYTMWEATLNLEKLEAINSSTNNSNINQLFLEVSQAYEDRDWTEVNRISDRLKVEKEYNVLSKNSTE